MFSCEFYEIFKHTFFIEHLQWQLLLFSVLSVQSSDEPEIFLVKLSAGKQLLEIKPKNIKKKNLQSLGIVLKIFEK